MIEEEGSSGVGIIYSDNEKGNKAHRADTGEFASKDDAGGVGSESKPSMSALLKAALKLTEGKAEDTTSETENINQKQTWSEVLNSIKQRSIPEECRPENIISLKNFDRARSKYFETGKNYRNMSMENFYRIKAKFDPLIKHAVVGCNFYFNKILDFIKSGEILNQFSLGGESEGSSFTPTRKDNGRAQMSHYTFGSQGVWEESWRHNSDYVSEEVLENRKKLEKYGCLMDNDIYSAINNRIASHYGDCFFVMNDDIKKRSTFTIGDSLGEGYEEPSVQRSHSGYPMMIEEGLDYRQLGNINDSKANEILRSVDSINSFTKNTWCGYVECQMHGPVKLDRDVYACCCRPTQWESDSGKKALEYFRSVGVKCLTARPGMGYLEEVILTPDGRVEYIESKEEKINE